MNKLYTKLVAAALVVILVSGFIIGVNFSKRIDRVDDVKDAAPPLEIVVTREAPPIGIININTATKEELMMLEGIGDILSDRIIERRETVGPYTSTDQLLEIEGLGEQKFWEIETFVVVE